MKAISYTCSDSCIYMKFIKSRDGQILRYIKHNGIVTVSFIQVKKYEPTAEDILREVEQEMLK